MVSGYITVNPELPDSYSIELEQGKILPIGRQPASEGSSKLVLPMPEVSAQHAEIRFGNRGWAIIDSGSTNGTRLNGHWLTAGREYPIYSGDRIKIAAVELLVKLSNATRPEAPQEIRQTHAHIDLLTATILVGDLRGFTTLTEQFAEKPQLLMLAAQKVFKALSDRIYQNSGTLEKIAGDAIMAYWQDQSDISTSPAYQACLTALQLRSMAKVLGQDKTCWPFDHPLQIDIALATGPVAAGALGHKETIPALLGDTANLAFALEKLVGADTPGNILVDSTTYAIVQNDFVLKSLGEFKLKGRLAPVHVYTLVDFQEKAKA